MKNNLVIILKLLLPFCHSLQLEQAEQHQHEVKRVWIQNMKRPNQVKILQNSNLFMLFPTASKAVEPSKDDENDQYYFFNPWKIYLGLLY